MHENVCKNCGNSFAGTYCNSCGEKLYSESDKKLSRIFDETFHFITHLDSKFLKSIRVILFKPGLLATEYCSGIRKKYFKPVSLFFIGVIIYLLFPLTQGLNMSLQSNISTFNSSRISIVQTAAEKKAEKKNITLEQLAVLYDSRSPKIAKLMLLLILPMAGGILYLLFSKKRPLYFDHFILGTEMSTMFIYFNFFLLPLFLNLVVSIYKWITQDYYIYTDWLTGPIIIVVFVIAWTTAFKRFYHLTTGRAILKAMLFLLLFMIATFVVYRLILFFTVLLFL